MTQAMRAEFMVFWLPRFHRLGRRGMNTKIALTPRKAFEAASQLKAEVQSLSIKAPAGVT